MNRASNYQFTIDKLAKVAFGYIFSYFRLYSFGDTPTIRLKYLPNID